jgi:SprT protein
MKDMIDAVDKCIDKAFEEFGICIRDDLTIRWDLRGQAAGQACKKGDNLILRLNLQAISLDRDWVIKEVIPHEIAHLICFIAPYLGRNHNRNWRNVCVRLGGSGSTTHDKPLKKARNVRQYVYHKGDQKVKVTSIRHKRIQKGVAYRLTSGERLDKTWDYKEKNRERAI